MCEEKYSGLWNVKIFWRREKMSLLHGQPVILCGLRHGGCWAEREGRRRDTFKAPVAGTACAVSLSENSLEVLSLLAGLLWGRGFYTACRTWKRAKEAQWRLRKRLIWHTSHISPVYINIWRKAQYLKINLVAVIMKLKISSKILYWKWRERERRRRREEARRRERTELWLCGSCGSGSNDIICCLSAASLFCAS